MEGSARLVAVRLLRHGGIASADFSENRDHLFVAIDPLRKWALVLALSVAVTPATATTTAPLTLGATRHRAP
jgi:hypothetical protein